VTKIVILFAGVVLAGSLPGAAQEASSGLELHATVSALSAYSDQLTAAPRDGNAVTGGLRLMLYSTWKLDDHWSVSGTLQARSRPYFYEEFPTQGYGARADILQLHLDYSRITEGRSLVIRVGELSSAFGSFLPRYDDAVNPLIDVPLSYGYYGRGVSVLSLAGAQVDVTTGKLDARAQFVNSSPANRRSIFDSEQYGNWAGGVGYTILPGFRVGVSAFRGPYLDRHFEFYFPGEVDPHLRPGTGYDVEVQWGHGPWSAYGELQRFQLTYSVIPTFNEHTGYGELRRVISPRWFVAARVSYLRNNAGPGLQVYETTVAFRPNRFQILKAGYEAFQGPAIHGATNNVLALQLVSSIPSLALTR
jgi:hypothetical protein